MVEVCEVCFDVADVFDNFRMRLWEAIGFYSCGCKDRAIRAIKYAITQSHEILDRVLLEIKDEKLKNKLIKAFEETKNEAEEIIKMMNLNVDPDDIVDRQFEEFEGNQFERQHKLFYECMLVECTLSGTQEAKSKDEIKRFMELLKKDLKAKKES